MKTIAGGGKMFPNHWNKLRNSKIFWPLLALIALLIFNYFFIPGFFSIEIKDGHLFGTLIDILNRAAPLIIVSIGMTLVIATAGVDISVGGGCSDIRSYGSLPDWRNSSCE
ncbi:hypothetical protein GCM10020331_099410 [Ectobacillus funiculus]